METIVEPIVKPPKFPLVCEYRCGISYPLKREEAKVLRKLVGEVADRIIRRNGHKK